MKNHLSIIGMIILIQQIGISQLSLDSLKIELEKKFVQERSGNDWNAYTIKYLNKDSLVRFIIPFNRKNEIEESIWGIALSEYKYDDKEREIERRYYDKNGVLHFSDWPPIIKIYYDDKDRIIRKDYFGTTEKPVSGFARLEIDYNEEGEVKEERKYNGEYKLDGKRAVTRFEYKDSNKVVIESRYNQDLELVINENVAYRKDKFLSKQREKILETRFLDKDKKLVEIEDSFSKIKYAIVKYTYPENKNGMEIKKYDSKMNLVNESWQYIPPKKK